ncbi:hypothetical protein NIES2119_27445 [[Phormidium ambiguum] IAM M-71]|uniref:Uncharacterized protein n=1 Tax=[Phormidium ambiguum] IAM M-71 TaxID=454136 RepID=A0A1U7I6N2_9CYAN|nr:hypothetical protein [Phormidium ambiguum]OKH31963.1 hypothetical protein NIES2119_27445 [Phormidium ambiguum IAM M-71]
MANYICKWCGKNYSYSYYRDRDYKTQSYCCQKCRVEAEAADLDRYYVAPSSSSKTNHKEPDNPIAGGLGCLIGIPLWLFLVQGIYVPIIVSIGNYLKHCDSVVDKCGIFANILAIIGFLLAIPGIFLVLGCLVWIPQATAFLIHQLMNNSK